MSLRSGEHFTRSLTHQQRAATLCFRECYRDLRLYEDEIRSVEGLAAKRKRLAGGLTSPCFLSRFGLYHVRKR
jgi:hypothetical protein